MGQYMDQSWTSISSRFVEGGYEWSEHTRGGSPLDHRERYECMEFRHCTVTERCHKIKSSAGLCMKRLDVKGVVAIQVASLLGELRGRLKVENEK